MKKKLVVRTAKLLSENRRFKTDTGISIAYEHQPKDPSERKKGIIFAVIEILAPPHSAEEIAELIIDTFHDEYYKDLDKDALSSFESALSRINKELASVTEEGKIHWLGKLNAILAVFSENTLHLTQAGKAETILYRKGKSSVVSQDLAGDAINPLRTFINISSGELLEGDRVGIFSPGVFYHLSNEELEQYITKFHPHVAINHLANIIKENNSFRRSSAIIIEILTPETLAGDTISEEKEDEVWIDDTKGGVEAITESATPIALRITKKSLNLLGLVVVFIAENLIPFIKSQAEKIKGLFPGSSKTNEENIFIETKEAISPQRENPPYFEEKSFKEIEKESSKGSVAQEKPERSLLVFSTFKKFALNTKITRKLLPKNSKILLIILLAVFLALTSFFSINKKRIEKQKNFSQSTLNEAITKYNEADNFIILGDNEKAVSSLFEARTLAEKVKKTGYFKKESEELLEKITTKIDSAMGIVRIFNEPFFDFSTVGAKNTTGFAAISSKIYTISDKNDILAVDTENGKGSVILSGAELEGKTIAISSIEDTSILVILTDKPQVYNFDTKTKELTKARISGDEWEKGIDISSFLTNIYIASKEEKNIYKHIKTTGGYSKRIGYLKNPDDYDLSDIVSFAIDGNIYILKANGAILKFTSGVQKDFSIKGLPEPIKEPKKIFTSTSIKGLFVVNGNKIIRIDDKNNFIKQFTSDSFSDITGLYADNTNLYVLTRTKVFKISY